MRQYGCNLINEMFIYALDILIKHLTMENAVSPPLFIQGVGPIKGVA